MKKVDEKIIELLIPKKAKRSCATTRKHRCEYAKVVSIDGKKTKGLYVVNTSRVETRYEVGKIVKPDSYNEDRWNECSNGIHFFLTKKEAENWS